ncbi:MAG: proton-conducting transporter membrane subunit [Planctomycetota bacterium]
MTELHFPWLELAILLPLVGAIVVPMFGSAERARQWTLAILGLSLLGTIAAWIDFERLRAVEAHDRWDVLHYLFGRDLLALDEFSAPLLTLVSLLGFLMVLVTLRTKVQRVSFSSLLLGQAFAQATFSAKEPWLLIGLLLAALLPPWWELKSRSKPTGVYLFHMGLFAAFLVGGWWVVKATTEGESLHYLGGVLLVIAVLLRCGVAPLHCWMTDLFEHAAFGSAILFVAPMAGAYAAVRLVVPEAPDWSLKLLVWTSIFTSVYSAGMALVQLEARRFFVYLFLSHASLVLVGLETATTEAWAGALSVWFATSLSLAGFGLTLRSIESRFGRLSLTDYHGLYEHMPNLAVLFLLTGLASVGFPGTIGFISTELLVDGVIHLYPWSGAVIVLAAALNGVAVMRVYFKLFTGPRHSTSIDLRSRPAERLAVLVLVAVMIGGGIYPQPFLSSRYRAAEHLLGERANTHPQPMHSGEESKEREAEDERTELERESETTAARAIEPGQSRSQPLVGVRRDEPGSEQLAKRPPRNRDAVDDH